MRSCANHSTRAKLAVLLAAVVLLAGVSALAGCASPEPATTSQTTEAIVTTTAAVPTTTEAVTTTESTEPVRARAMYLAKSGEGFGYVGGDGAWLIQPQFVAA